MNIAFANTIPMPEILAKIGLQPVEEQSGCLIYPSPLHSQSASFLHISTEDNKWHDTGANAGGAAIAFVQAWLKTRNELCSVIDALHWLKFNIGYPSLFAVTGLPDTREADKEYQFNTKTLLLERGLIRYVESQGIPAALARQHLKQVYVRSKITRKKRVAIGIRNEEGGYAVRSPSLNANTAPVSITVIRGQVSGMDSVHIFYDMFDYLRTLFQQQKAAFDEDSIILHAYYCIDDASSYVLGFGFRKVYTWFDNSEEGKRLTEAFSQMCQMNDELIQHEPMAGVAKEQLHEGN